jgi:hypothetical protein
MRTEETHASRWRWGLGFTAIFAMIVVPAILADGGGSSQANDMMDYHSIEIRRLQVQWPTPDLRDSFSTTTPGFHLVLAGLAKLGLGALGLRLVAALAGLAAWLVAWRVAMVWCGARRAALLVAPLALSPYVLGSAIWLTTDATALALAAAAMGVALIGWRGSRGAALAGVLGAGTVLVRQIMLWAAVPAALRALVGPGRTAERAWMLALALLPAVACVGAFFVLWGGSMPPRFQPFHQATWNPAAITLTLALFGGFGVFLLPWVWGRIDGVARRGAMVAAIACAMLAAVPRSDYRKVLPPDEQRVGTRTEKTWGPTAPGVVKGAGEVGRWGGPIWDAARVAPVIAGRSSLLVALAGLGGWLMMSLWSAADRLGRRLPASMLLAGIGAMVLAQCLNAQTFERYFDPWVLLALGWLAAMAASASDRRLSWGVLALTATQLAMSAAVVLKPAFTGPPLGLW